MVTSEFAVDSNMDDETEGARSENSRGWTAFSNPNKGERKKVGYTVEPLMQALKGGN